MPIDFERNAQDRKFMCGSIDLSFKTACALCLKIAALADLICRAGDEAGTKSAALLVLMSTLENATHPKALANLAKHLAFTRCSELNLNGMVEAQIAVLERELLADDTLVS